jgi:hypothetical protein
MDEYRSCTFYERSSSLSDDERAKGGGAAAADWKAHPPGSVMQHPRKLGVTWYQGQECRRRNNRCFHKSIPSVAQKLQVKCNCLSNFLTIRENDWADWSTGNAVYLYVGGDWFESRAAKTGWRTLWFSSVPPGKCRYGTSIRPGPPPSKSLQTHQPRDHPTQYSADDVGVVRHLIPIAESNWVHSALRPPMGLVY